MLPTLEHSDRVKLEANVLQAICQRNSLMMEVEILDSYFSNQLNKRLWLAIKEIKQLGHEISIAELADNFKIEELSFYFEENVFSPLPSFVKAVKLLEEDFKKQELNKIFTHAKNTTELLQDVHRIEAIGISQKLKSVQEQLPEYQETMKKRKEMMRAKGTTGLIYDWKALKEYVRMEAGELIIVGARPSIGKTAWSLDLAIQAAFYDQRVLFITMEMASSSIIDRLVSNVAKIELKEVKRANVNMEYIEREIMAVSNNLYVAHEPMATTDAVERLMSKMKFDLVVVDYLQLLRDKHERGELENYRIGRILKSLKAMAGKYNCVVLSPSQFSREGEKQARKPVLTDLRDSGNIEQDSDVVLLLHRANRDSVETDVIVAKNRNGKANIEVQMKYSPSFQVFKEHLTQIPYVQSTLG